MFKNLTLSKQYELLSREGKYIGVRQYCGYYINLYLLNDIFYEVFYDWECYHIKKLGELIDDKKLDLYIIQMNNLSAQ